MTIMFVVLNSLSFGSLSYRVICFVLLVEVFRLVLNCLPLSLASDLLPQFSLFFSHSPFSVFKTYLICLPIYFSVLRHWSVASLSLTELWIVPVSTKVLPIEGCHLYIRRSRDIEFPS